jgi:hypothetical protein
MGSVEKVKKRKMGQGPGRKGNEQILRGWIGFGFSVSELCDHLRIKTNYSNQIDNLNHS